MLVAIVVVLLVLGVNIFILSEFPGRQDRNCRFNTESQVTQVSDDLVEYAWSVNANLPPRVHGPMLVGSPDGVLLADRCYSIHLVDWQTGNVTWSTTVATRPTGLYYSDSHNLVLSLHPASPEQIYGYDYDSGNVLWQTPAGVLHRTSGSVHVNKGEIYLRRTDESTWSINPLTGELIPLGMQIGEWALHGDYVSLGQPSYTNSGIVQDTLSGDTLWKREDDSIVTRVVIHNNAVYALDKAGQLILATLPSGDERVLSQITPLTPEIVTENSKNSIAVYGSWIAVYDGHIGQLRVYDIK